MLEELDKKITEAMNERALKRLNNDIDKIRLSGESEDNKLFLMNVYITIKGEQLSLTTLFALMRKAIYENHKEQYCREEVEQFIKKVEGLKSQIDNIYGEGNQ